MTTTVVLADDHAVLRESLASYLAHTPDIRVVAQARDADQAVAAVLQHAPDVALLDIDMPGTSIFAAAQRMRAQCPRTRLVMLSAFCDDRYIARALKVGASGYLTKSEPLERIVKAIRDVAAGAACFSPDVRARLLIDGSGVRLERLPGTRLDALTEREIEVLGHLARGLANKEIASALHIANRTVDHHVARIMSKLDIHNRGALAQFAVRAGVQGT